MSQSEYLSKFTPSRNSPESLERIFVQREAVARDAETRLADGVLSNSKYHLLYVGPRGNGKTHLVSLLFHRLDRRDDLRDRLRVAWLAEDETTTSYLKLLLRIHRALHQRYPGEFPHIEPKAIPAHDEPGRVGVVERWLVERLAGRSLLVIVENLDLLMEGLGDSGQKGWRAFLQNQGVANTLATSQRITKDISSRSAPFHSFFRTVHLERLEIDEAVSLLTKIAETVTHQPDLAALLQTPTGRNRVRAIDHLTGGCHRLYIVLSEFLTRDSLDDLVRPFEAMIDELTPYYQERLRWLPGQQREIVEYLARAETTVAVKVIADDLMLTHQGVSSQLKKLSELGYVRNDRRGRESLYELAEPLMRICVEVKENGRGPIRLFVEFLRRWFSKEELEAKARMLAPEALTDRLYISLALASFEISDAASGSSEPEQRASGGAPSTLSIEELEEQAVTRGTLAAWMELGRAQAGQQHWELAIEAYDHGMAINPNHANLWIDRGIALRNLGRHEEALESLDRATAIDTNNANSWILQGFALVNLERHEEALESFDRAIAIAPNTAKVWGDRGLVLDYLGDHEEALKSYDRATAIDPKHANAWVYRAFTLGYLGRHQEAEKSFAQSKELCNSALESCKSFYRQGLWDKGDIALRDALRQFPPNRFGHKFIPDAIIQQILNSTRDRATWRFRAERLLALYRNANGLTQLGQALVTSLKYVPEARLNAEGLAAWREVWTEVSKDNEALKLPIRMFQVGMRYHETGDRDELLTLISEERSIVAEALGLDEDDR